MTKKPRPMRSSASNNGCTPTRLMTKIKSPRPSRKASACSQTKDRREVFAAEATGSSESSSVSASGQSSANSSLDSIKATRQLREGRPRRATPTNIYQLFIVGVALCGRPPVFSSSCTTRPGKRLNPRFRNVGTGSLSSRKSPVNANRVGTKLKLS